MRRASIAGFVKANRRQTGVARSRALALLLGSTAAWFGLCNLLASTAGARADAASSAIAMGAVCSAALVFAATIFAKDTGSVRVAYAKQPAKLRAGRPFALDKR